MLRPIWRLATISSADRSATLTLTLLVPLVSLSLTVLGFRRTLGWLARTANLPSRIGGPEHVVQLGVAAMGRVRRYTPWTGRCLARALSLWWVLRRRGIDAKLNLGARVRDGVLDAHAWVTHQGAILADSNSVGADFPATFQAGNDLVFTRDR